MPSSSSSRKRSAAPSSASPKKKASKAKPAKQPKERVISQAEMKKFIAGQKKRFAQIKKESIQDGAAAPSSVSPKKKASKAKTAKKPKEPVISQAQMKKIMEGQKKRFAQIKKESNQD